MGGLTELEEKFHLEPSNIEVPLGFEIEFSISCSQSTFSYFEQ